MRARVAGWIVRVLGLDGAREAADAARDAAARAGLAAARAEGAAASVLALSQSPVWYHSAMTEWHEDLPDMTKSHGTGVQGMTESHDKMSGMPDRHDRMAGGPGGATGRAWRLLDNDIETLD